jgi:hypothetical protein
MNVEILLKCATLNAYENTITFINNCQGINRPIGLSAPQMGIPYKKLILIYRVIQKCMMELTTYQYLIYTIAGLL